MARKGSPNVIVFFTDQQRWDTSGLHGNPLDLTPNFDRVAVEGTHLPLAFTCQPVCGPARSSLQTGLYATNTGCHTNGMPLSDGQTTLAHYFSRAGYRTAYIGKWHLASEEPVPVPQQGGYDYWLAANVLEFVSEPYRTVLFDRDGRKVELPGYRVDALTDAAIDYVCSHRENPFFLFLSYLEPHHQNHIDDYPAPAGYRERYTGRWRPPDLEALGGSSAQHLGGYFGIVKRLDEAFGRLLDALRSLSLLDDTIILYTSDHGCHFKTRNDEYKRSCHESSIRVPTLLTGPGFTGAGRFDRLVSLIDLPPTLLDATGIPVPGTMEGSSLLPALRGDAAAAAASATAAVEWQDDIYVQISESQVGRAVRTRRWKYGVDAPGADRRSPVAAVYEEQYLYDLEADPYELNNLIGRASHRAAANVMKERLLNRMRAVGEPTPEIRDAPETPGGQRRVSPEETMQ